MKIYLRHLRLVGYCVPSSRAWAKQHGVDWREFVRDGLDATVLESSGDALAMKLVEVARAEQQ